MGDRRLTPARPDLAAAHLKGKVEAARFVEGERYAVARGHTPLRAGPGDNTEQVSELLFGEHFMVYDRFPETGLAWGQNESDGYVGWLNEAALGTPFKADARVIAAMTPVFIRPDLKSTVIDFLPLNAVVKKKGLEADYMEVANSRYVIYRHLAPLDEHSIDFVAVAERFLGVPYVWGGKTFAGLDCSGLIQTALHATGATCPRDTDMQERALGARALGEVVEVADLRRGDLVFWKGHVGVMRDATELLHANAFHMQVAAEPLAEAIRRIEKIAGPVTSIKRL